MIVTDLPRFDRQCPMTDGVKKAVDFLRLRGLRDLPDGRVEIDGDRVFAIIQRYDTMTAEIPKFEFHRRYIDVQYIASGEEVIGWTPAERMNIMQDYDAGRDIGFGIAPAGWTPVYLQAGQLAVFYPEDGHAPRLAAVTPSGVMKIVVKVAV